MENHYATLVTITTDKEMKQLTFEHQDSVPTIKEWNDFTDMHKLDKNYEWAVMNQFTMKI